MDVITEPPESTVLASEEHYELWYRYNERSASTGTGQFDSTRYSLSQAREQAIQKNVELGEGRSYDVFVARVTLTTEEV